MQDKGTMYVLKYPPLFYHSHKKPLETNIHSFPPQRQEIGVRVTCGKRPSSFSSIWKLCEDYFPLPSFIKMNLEELNTQTLANFHTNLN